MKNKSKKYFYSSLALIVVFLVFYFSFLQTFYYNNNELINYTNGDCNLQSQACSTEAYLIGPKNAQNVSIIVSSDLEVWHGFSISNFNTKYEIFNYNTNSYDVLVNKIYPNINVPNNGGEIDYEINGENIYSSSTIIDLSSQIKYDSYWFYKYYACLPGMENQLLPTKEKSSYGYKYFCVYPGQIINDKSYDDDASDGYRITEVPLRYNIGSDYIKDGVIKFRINAPKYTGKDGNFKISEVWAGKSVWGLNNVEEPDGVNDNLVSISYQESFLNGEEEVYPNEQYSYLTTLYVDSLRDIDYSDGTYSTRWASIALVDNNGNVIQSSEWEMVEQLYEKNVTFTMPTNTDNYAVVSIIVEKHGTYNYDTKTWSYDAGTILKQETLNLTEKVKNPEDSDITYEKPLWSSFLDWLKSIVEYLKELF
jgi:hypothetical protein